MSAANRAPVPAKGDLLTLGFGTTVAMWAFGFISHKPEFALPSSAVFFGMLILLVLGGAAAGWLSPRGWRAGLWSGMIAGLLNLLILGSVIGRNEDGAIGLSAFVWVPAAVLIAMLLGAAGAALGTRLRSEKPLELNWPFSFTIVAMAATLVLLSVGGMVTGYEAGLAVVDWPNTEGYNMFLYPLSKMTGGIYYEHSHRLLGSLVGLTTLTLMIYLIAVRSPALIRNVAIVAFVMVVLQGIMGGLRVTGNFTLSTDPNDMTPSTALAAIHGVFGQVYFATLAILATLLTRTWQSAVPATPRNGVGLDRTLGWIALVALLAQIATGALVRHFAHLTTGLVLHVAGAVVVLGLVALFAVRAWGLNVDAATTAVRKMGLTLLAVGGLQLTFGIIAFVAILVEQQGSASQTFQVLLTTLHQTTGALMIATAAALLAWHYRLLTPAEETDRAAQLADGRFPAAGALK